MILSKPQLPLFLLWVIFSFRISAQQTITLPRSTPEAEGVSSKGIINFLDAIAKSKNEFHSFMFLRHGKVIAEGWWNPYAPNLKHTLYSLSKSFTSTAVGLALREGKIKVTDKVISFFPKELPDTISPYLRALTIKDLLTMSAGQEPDPTFAIVKKDNWIKEFLATPIKHQPGTVFLYNTMCTYMLSAIVQKATGQKIIDYLKPRLFTPLGIKGMDWEVDDLGINTGGWGLRLKTEDLAKFGQLYLQKGNWHGKQLLPRSWVEEATTFKILQSPEIPAPKRDSNDWLQGYCYQFWRCKHNVFRGDGAFGQYVIVMPDQDAVVVITSETSDMQNELNLVWEYILPSISIRKMQIDDVNTQILRKKLSTLKLPLFDLNTNSAASQYAGTYHIYDNKYNIKQLSLNFSIEKCMLTIKTDTSSFDFNFGLGKWLYGKTTRPGPYLIYPKTKFKHLPPFFVAGNFWWKDANTLELELRYIESPHSENIIFHFENNQLVVSFKNSFNQMGITVSGKKND